MAAATWTDVSALADCVSARELEAGGFADDVTLALEVDADDLVPRREERSGPGRAFTAW